MASNTFGRQFCVTTWGESHGRAIGVVIDGCPAGLPLSETDLCAALAKRSPGRSPYTSPRREPDCAEIYSGIFEGKTTGAPISIIIPNRDADSRPYEQLKHLYKPGHANYTYIQKYGSFDYRGGGRASARETACRVAAGAVAQNLLNHFGIKILCYLQCVHDVEWINTNRQENLHHLENKILESSIGCPNLATERLMIQAIEQAQDAGDSLGGVVSFLVLNMPVGWGDPIYQKLEANLAHAMLSLPASKGFEIGEGFGASRMQGSCHNDAFTDDDNRVMRTNHAGGVLGGISTGMPLWGCVAFKPTSSIRTPQETIDLAGRPQVFTSPQGSRHDPCVAIRAVPVVNAMCSLVLADALLMHQSSRIERLAA